MTSKARLRFHNRLAHYEADIELADIVKRAVASGSLTSSVRLFSHSSTDRHPRISSRSVTPNNRKIAIGHLNNTLRSSFLKDLYEDFTAYLQDVLHACGRKTLDEDRLIGEHKFSVDANVLLKLGSWENVLRHLTDTLFRKIENERSTKKLLLAFDAKLALGIDAQIRDTALPFFDMRHILVHRDGVVDQEFCETHPQLQYVTGSKLNLSYTVVTNAKNAISDLVNHIDERILGADLLLVSDTNQ